MSNPPGRFEATEVEAVDDGWTPPPDPLRPLTELKPETIRTLITRNQSPDVPFEQSINPYRGCEHGCIYCYARPSHAFLNLSPGLDFETRIFYKAGAVERLRTELSKPGYRCRPITLGANTDPYQPVERGLQLTRQLLEVFHAFGHPLSIITKAALIERDLDLLSRLARRQLVSVLVSVTTLDDTIKRTLEPRTAAPARRLKSIERLSRAGIPVGVLVAPVIPGLTDHEIDAILAACAAAGARSAGYVMLRLPNEVKDLFVEWLRNHHPLRAEHVMSLIRDMRGGRDNDPRFGHRMRGNGPYAQLIRQQFAIACRRHGLAKGERAELATAHFSVPRESTPQLSLFEP